MILALGGWKQEFNVIPIYIMSLKPDWARRDHNSIENNYSAVGDAPLEDDQELALQGKCMSPHQYQSKSFKSFFSV